jgi:hypothetical protein
MDHNHVDGLRANVAGATRFGITGRDREHRKNKPDHGRSSLHIGDCARPFD